MGATNCILPRGWETEVKTVLTNAVGQMKAFGELSLRGLSEFAVHFARTVSITGEADYKNLLTKEVLKGGLTIYLSHQWDAVIQTVTNKHFLDFCRKLVTGIANKTAFSPKAVKETILRGIQESIHRICGNECSPIVNAFFNSVVKSAEEKIAKEAAGSAASNVITSGASAMKSAGKNVSKFSKATKCAGAAFKSSVIIDGTLLSVSAGYSYYKYQTGACTWEEHKEVVKKRSASTAGSVGGTTTGAFVGSLILPGVGTFVGGFIGGIAGDWLGGKAYDELTSTPERED